MDAEQARTPSGSTSEDAAVLGSAVTESISPDPGMDDGEVELSPTEKPIIADGSTLAEQRNYPTLRLLEIILGIGLVVLIVLTILVRRRSQNYF
jgi:hypothetical protein